MQFASKRVASLTFILYDNKISFCYGMCLINLVVVYTPGIDVSGYITLKSDTSFYYWQNILSLYNGCITHVHSIHVIYTKINQVSIRLKNCHLY
jgi:hypothetical protein